MTPPTKNKRQKQRGTGKGSKSAQPAAAAQELYEVERLVARQDEYVLVQWSGEYPLSWVHRHNLQAGGPLVSHEDWFEQLPLYEPATMGRFEGLP